MTNQFVLYNTCFGGFSFNRNFILELFQRFPPHTPGGQVILTFSENCQDLLQCVKTPFFDDYHFLIEDEDDNDNDSKNIINVKTEKIYLLNRNQNGQRANKDLIAFLFERAEKMTEEVFNSEYDKVLSKNLFESELNENEEIINSIIFTGSNFTNKNLLKNIVKQIGLNNINLDDEADKILFKLLQHRLF